MKINISINDDLVKRIDDYSKSNFLTRSGFISMCANDYLNQKEFFKCVSDLTVIMQKVSETNILSDEDVAKLKQIESVFNIISQNR